MSIESKISHSEGKIEIIKKIPKWVIAIPFMAVFISMVIAAIPSISQASDKT